MIRIPIMVFTGLMAGIGLTSLAAPTDVLAQARSLSDVECRAARERLAEHARLSDGVRRDLDRKAPGA